MTIAIFVLAIIAGIVSPLIWMYFTWFKSLQSYLQCVVVAAEEAIPDNTEYAKLARIDYALKLYIRFRGLDATKDAAAVASIRAAIALLINGKGE